MDEEISLIEHFSSLIQTRLPMIQTRLPMKLLDTIGMLEWVKSRMSLIFQSIQKKHFLQSCDNMKVVGKIQGLDVKDS